MIIFRLCREIYSRDLTGKGAERSGGRWNSKRVSMLYTSETRALCLAETAVNLPLNLISGDFAMVSILVPDDLPVKTVSLKELPSDWNTFPHSASTQKTGDNFIHAGEYVALRVPSAVVPMEFNVLINPLHPLMKMVKITEVNKFAIDERLTVRR